MTPKKRELLDVLRQREDRGGAPNSQTLGANAPQRRSLQLHIPPLVLKAVAGVLLIVVVLWALYSDFGGPAEVHYSVLAKSYELSRVEQAKNDGRALRDHGYDVTLLQAPDPSGQALFVLFVGSSTDASTLQELLDEVRTLTLPGGELPFSGASIQELPEA